MPLSHSTSTRTHRAAATSVPRSTPLTGTSIAVLATDGFEQSELMLPHRALAEAGATVVIIAPKAGSIIGWNRHDWGRSVRVDRKLSAVRAEDFDALVLPGGTLNADTLRLDKAAIALTRDFVHAGTPIAAICHGPWLLIEAGGAEGHRLTSWPSLRTDLINAGATWVDQPVVIDRQLITSRKPDDIPAFNRAIIRLLTQQQGSLANAVDAPERK